MKTFKLDKKDVPANQIKEIKMVYVSDEFFYEVRYWFDGWTYCTLLPKDKGYALQKAVRKEMEKMQRG